MESRFFGIGLTVVALVIGSGGCATDGTDDLSPDDSMSSGTDSEFSDGSLGAGSEVSAQTIGELQTVYFEYDKSSIRSDSAETLRTNAALIKNNDRWGRVVVQGNTDERGSEEYNLALGERRATAVKRYLIDLGVSAERLRTVSFGEATPAVPGHDESAYRYNRRSDFASN
jgi:peptidoglycan-associated lipoprotein